MDNDATMDDDPTMMSTTMQDDIDIHKADGYVVPTAFPCLVDKVLIKDGMKLGSGQTAILVKKLLPSPVPLLDTFSESEKVKHKKVVEEEARVAGIYPIQDVISVPENSPRLIGYDKQDVIENFKTFDTVIDHSDHLFSAYTPAMKQPDWVNTIKEEWRILEQHLPDTIFVRVYEPRMDLLRAAIVGPEGTPYHDGLFFFDLFFPNDYPNSPPLLRYHSGGLGINPNLKMCGQVCLSLFNTAEREERVWTPGTNILKLLIFIQTTIFNPRPFYNSRGLERMRGSDRGEFLALLYNENTIVKSLKTMAHTMNQPPKNFEDLVVGHFRKRLPDIQMSCKAYMEGLQVGCLVNKYPHTCSLEFKNEVASCIKPLVDAFNKIGANEAQKFLLLIKEKNVVVDDYMGDGVNKKRKVVFDEDHLNEAANKVIKLQDGDACHDGSDYHYAPWNWKIKLQYGDACNDGSDYHYAPWNWKIRSRLPCTVVKVLVEDGMKLEAGQPLYVRDNFKMEDINRHRASLPRPESAIRRILELNHSSRIGIFSMEDVIMDQDGADLDSSPLSGLHIQVVQRRHKNFKKFAFVMDDADHFFSARNSAMNQLPEDWAGKIYEELGILEEQLPETIYVRSYKSRMDLLRAVIIGPDSTPYHGGLFFFDLCFPSDYPDSPPLVHYHSGGLGINPNLLKCGKVRLNLPTKSGGWELMWVPGTTTMLQLLVSIQNQILKADPLFNEPAYATMKGCVYGEYASFLYNETAIIKSLKTMLYIMNKPPKNFEEFVVDHFRIRAHDIVSACNKKHCSSTFKKDLYACINPLLAAFKKTGAKTKK